MAHNIFENDTVLTVMGSWHGLDKQQDQITHEDLAPVFSYGLYEQPVSVPVNYTDSENNEKVTHLNNNLKMIYRLDDNGFPINLTPKGIGRDYKPLKGPQILDILEPLNNSGLLKIVSAGTLKNGAKRWVQWDLSEFEVAGLEFRNKLLFFDSVNGETSVGFGKTNTCVVCDNTFTSALKSSASKLLRARHSQNVVQNVELIRDVINQTNLEFIATQEQFERLSKVVINSEDLPRLIKQIFSSKTEEELDISKKQSRVLTPVTDLFESGIGNNLPQVRGTGLALFQAVTQYINFERGGDSRSARLDSVLTVNSTANKIVDKAMGVLLAV